MNRSTNRKKSIRKQQEQVEPKQPQKTTRFTDKVTSSTSITDEIKLSNLEKCLLSPCTFWKHLTAARTSQDYDKMFKRLVLHATQQFNRSQFAEPASISRTNQLVPNYMTWVSHFADDDPKQAALPTLVDFMAQMFKAKLYIETIPHIQFLFVPAAQTVRSQFNQSTHTNEQLRISLHRQKAVNMKKTQKACEFNKALNTSRSRDLERLLQATKTCKEIVDYEAQKFHTRGAGLQPVEDEDAEKQAMEEKIEKLEELNLNGRKILAQLITELVAQGHVTKHLQKFMFNLANNSEKELDLSRLAPCDLVFLVDDTGILRSKTVKGEIVMELNE